MKKILLIILVLSVTTISGQSVWQITNTPIGGTIWDIEASSSGYMFTITGSGMFRSNDNGTSWEPIYFANGIIRVLTVTGSGDIYASHDSLVYKSTDNGTSWDVVLTTSGNFISLTSGPQNAVYGCTMGPDGIMFLHFSFDGGQTWEHKLMDFTSYSHITLHINSSGDIFSASFEGLYKSVDQGDTWQMIYDERVRSLVINSNDDLFIGLSYGSWIYESTNGGSSWTQLYEASGIYPLAIDQSGYIYASANMGLFRISPDGLIWSQINKGLPDNEILAIYTNPEDVVFVGNDGIYKSSNNGVDWTLSSDGLNTDSYTWINSSPDGHIYIISDALYMSSDEGATYSRLVDFHDYDKGFSKLYFHPDGDLFAVGHNGYLSDGFTLFRSSDNGASFTELIHIQIYDFTINQDGKIFLITMNGLMTSIDKGDSWQLVPVGDCSYFNHIFASQDGTIYLSGCDGTYTSNDNGETFALVSNLNLDFRASNAGGDVFAIDPDNVYLTTDNGVTWETIYTNTLPYHQIKDLIVDPFGTIYFNLSFFGIYKSTDNGVNWTLFNEGLINNNIIAIHASNNGTLYISPEYNGVWKRSANPTIVNSANTLEVYPNPAKEKINIRLSGNSFVEGALCQIYNMQGRLMKQVVITSNSNEVGLEGFEPGVYLVKSSNSSQKILIQ